MLDNIKPIRHIAPNDITLLLGNSIGSNIRASLSHSADLTRTMPSGSVLYINTVQNRRSMLNSARAFGFEQDGDNDTFYVDGRRSKAIYILNVIKGELNKWRPVIKEYLAEGYIQYIVINSWEFAARNSRYRDDLIFLLKELTDGLEGGHPPMNVLIYAEELNSQPDAQRIHRGGYGKLTGIVKRIECISVKESMTKDAITRGEDDAELREAFDAVSKAYEVLDEPQISNEETADTTIESPEDRGNTLEVHFAPVFMPRSAVGRRATDFQFQPINMNGYSPDSPPIPQAPQRAPGVSVHSQIIKK